MLDARERLNRDWLEAYGPLVAEQLDADRRYSVIRAGAAEYAFADYDRYVRALSQLWDAGVVPATLPSALGSELLDVAPHLQGVDVDLSGLDSDSARPQPRRRFA